MSRFLYDLFGMEPRASSSRPDPDEARHGRRVGLHRRERCDRRWSAARSTTSSARARARSTARRSTCTCRTSLGRSWQMGTIQLDAQMPQPFGLTYMGADNHEHTPYVVHRALLGSLERFMGILIEHYGGAFPVWLAPVQVACAPGRGGAPRGRSELAKRARTWLARGRRRRARRDARQADPRRRAGEGPVRRRLGRPRDPRGDGRAQARGTGGRRRSPSTRSSRRSPSRVRCPSGRRRSRIPPRALRVVRWPPASRSGIAPHLAGTGRAGFNRVGSDEGMPPLRAVAFPRKRRIDSTW